MKSSEFPQNLPSLVERRRPLSTESAITWDLPAHAATPRLKIEFTRIISIDINLVQPIILSRSCVYGYLNASI